MSESKSLFWTKYKDAYTIISYSSLKSLANQSEASTNHSLDWFSYPAIIHVLLTKMKTIMFTQSIKQYSE